MSGDDIELECPHCRQRLMLPASKAGTSISCPDCGAQIEVPGESRMQSTPSWPRPDAPTSDEDGDYDDLSARIRRTRPAPSGSLYPPAICMIVVAALGLLLNLSGFVIAVTDPAFGVDPNAPPMIQQFVRDSKGAFPAAVQGTCALMSALTILGSVQVLRRKTWGLGLTAAILSMINFGNCCCLLGLPFGIWAIVAITNAEVRDSFS
jgi:hypothetical protein